MANSRCWPGYEPVPGKKKHEQGSCRKKAASKTGAKGKKVQRARRTQLDRWQKAHPHSRKSAAQGLEAPRAAGAEGKKKPARRTAAEKQTGRKAAPRKRATRKHATARKRPSARKPSTAARKRAS